ncbi:MAG TPA: Gfo/Idh/MocA family oxidoreductase [Pirellulaceae bacterium]|nr:Gfo/Idh/MocA family oxidoreductase [Pirellulaceae bacterium]
MCAAAALRPARAAEPKRAPIKIGQIGVGHAHASKLAVYRQSADYEVVGIVEPDEKLRQAAQSQVPYKDLPWMTQEQLLNQPGLQAVLVETRVRDLLDTAEACMSAGKHIHLDKPAGESLPQFARILESAERQKLLVQMGYMFRYNPGFLKLKEFIKSGWLGEIFEVHAVMSKVVPPAERKRLAEYPGGILFELGCHVVDLVIGILGKPKEVSGFHQHASPLDDTLLDNMLAVFTYDKASASVKSSAQEVDGFARRHLTVCGTEGTFHIQPLDDPRGRLTLSRPRGEYQAGYQDVPLPKYTRYVDDAADMARVIRGEKAGDFSYEHDLAVQESLLRACHLPLDR